jgi:phosphoribosyl 1,2-cyclic phosphodiesterase
MRAVLASVLASGSGGNCVYVEADGAAVLIDCGLTVPGLKRRLAELGRDLSKIQAVFVTHDHGDHVGSSVALARKLGIPLHATAGTHSILGRLPEGLARIVHSDEAIAVGGFSVLPFTTPHDGIESVAFRVTHDASQRSLGVATDLGYVSRQVVERLLGVHLLVVEHNHDERMLIEGPYPEGLKRRILGGRGHLSNEQGAALASHVMHGGLRQIVLAHLSETNNTPDHARRAFEKANAAAPVSLALHVAEQHRASPLFDV